MKNLPKPEFFDKNGKGWKEWGKELISRLEKTEQNKAPQLPSFPVASLPSAADKGVLIFVPNESGGATVAYSDGTDWRRVTDGAIVS